MPRRFGFFAWIGAEQRMPLVVVETASDRIATPELFAQLQELADQTGRDVTLARFEYVQKPIVIKPRIA